jgi:hypothetical protein
MPDAMISEFSLHTTGVYPGDWKIQLLDESAAIPDPVLSITERLQVFAFDKVIYLGGEVSQLSARDWVSAIVLTSIEINLGQEAYLQVVASSTNQLIVDAENSIESSCSRHEC